MVTPKLSRKENLRQLLRKHRNNAFIFGSTFTFPPLLAQRIRVGELLLSFLSCYCFVFLLLQ